MSSPDPSEVNFQVILNLMREVWVLQDRQRVLEHLLAESGISAETVDTYQPDEALKSKLDAERKAFVAKVLAPTKEA
ncbi:MAG: hypothetical protein AAGA23_16970 [Pseudomonadota bacterium]